MPKNTRKIYYTQSIDKELYYKLIARAKKIGIREQLLVEMLIKKHLEKGEPK